MSHKWNRPIGPWLMSMINEPIIGHCQKLIFLRFLIVNSLRYAMRRNCHHLVIPHVVVVVRSFEWLDRINYQKTSFIFVAIVCWGKNNETKKNTHSTAHSTHNEMSAIPRQWQRTNSDDDHNFVVSSTCCVEMSRCAKRQSIAVDEFIWKLKQTYEWNGCRNGNLTRASLVSLNRTGPERMNWQWMARWSPQKIKFMFSRKFVLCDECVST